MPDIASVKDRQFDLVVWGASGFTGRLVVEYLAERYPPGDALRWAVAGRNEAKLKKVLADAPFRGDLPGIIVADSHDRAALHNLTASASVILTTVGPYAKYGSDLVEACVTNGTDYCDLCGEVQWMRQMIDRHQADAEVSGARIVMSCGFDSIPSDIGVQYLQTLARQAHGEPCVEIKLLVRAMKGGASGGTIASMLNAIEQARQDQAVRRILADPYGLNPEGQRHGPDGRDQHGPRFDTDAAMWTAPFVMGGVNTRVVRRTNALLGYPYGDGFHYSESTMSGKGFRGRVRSNLMSWGLMLFVGASTIPVTRRVFVQRMVPKPGEGPSREERENGYFNMLLIGKMPDGEQMRLRIRGDRDPGYGSTSKMLAESAVCLAKDDLKASGGFWTPASALGDALMARLTEYAGLSFDPE